MNSVDEPFRVPFNPRPLQPPRTLRLVCIGAGPAGLTLAYKIMHELKLGELIDFMIYERQVQFMFSFLPLTQSTLPNIQANQNKGDVGGTWLANQYPGLTCDVPVHVFTLPW